MALCKDDTQNREVLIFFSSSFFPQFFVFASLFHENTSAVNIKRSIFFIILLYCFILFYNAICFFYFTVLFFLFCNVMLFNFIVFLSILLQANVYLCCHQPFREAKLAPKCHLALLVRK
jgi:hypothetical protein